MGSAEARAHELGWQVDPASGGGKDAEHGGRGGCGREYGPRELSGRRRVGETRGTPPECADGSEAFTVGDAGKAGEDEHKETEKHLVVGPRTRNAGPQPPVVLRDMTILAFFI